MYALLLNLLLGNKLVECVNIHAKSLGNASHIATYVTKSKDTELLALQLTTTLTVEEITNCEHQQTKHQFGYSVRVLSGSVLNNNTFFLSIGGIDRVVTGTGTYHNLQVLSSVEHLRSNLV